VVTVCNVIRGSETLRLINVKMFLTLYFPQTRYGPIWKVTPIVKASLSGLTQLHKKIINYSFMARSLVCGAQHKNSIVGCFCSLRTWSTPTFTDVRFFNTSKQKWMTAKFPWPVSPTRMELLEIVTGVQRL